MAHLRVVVLLIMAGGCIDSNLERCGDLLCPSGTVCVDATRCVTRAQVTACEGHADGDPCIADDLAGQCASGTCLIETCGNGVVEPGEVCDDGNRISGDGCRADCKSNEECGNGLLDLGEACDCGSSAGDQPTYCRQINSDALDADCDLHCTRHCGDGTRTGAEQCDGSDTPYTCQSFGFYAGTIGCTPVCTVDTTACSGRCGDGIVQTSESELCDGSPPPGDTCVGFGFGAGDLECSALCGPALGSCEPFGWEKLIPPGSHFYSDAVANDVGVLAIDESVMSAATGSWNSVAFTHGTGYQHAVASTAWLGAASATTLSIFDGVSWTDVALPAAPVAIDATAAGSVYTVTSDGRFDRYASGAWTQLASVPDSPCLAMLVVSDAEIYVTTSDTNVNDSGTLWSWDGQMWSQIAIPNIGDVFVSIGKRDHGLVLGGYNGAVQLPEGTQLAGQYTWGIAARDNIALGAGDNEPYFLVDNQRFDLPWIDDSFELGYTHGARLTKTGMLLAWGAGVYRLNTTLVQAPITQGQRPPGVSVGPDGRLWACDEGVYLLGGAPGAAPLPVSFGRALKVIGTFGDVVAITDYGVFHGNAGGWGEYGEDGTPYDGWYDASADALYILTTPGDYPSGVVMRSGTDLVDLASPLCAWSTISGRAGVVYVAGTCSGAPALYTYDGTSWTALVAPPAPLIAMYVAPDGQVFGTSGTRIYRFDGTTWTTLGTLAATDVAGVSATEVYFQGNFIDHNIPVIERWDGTMLSPVRLPLTGFDYSIAAGPGAVLVHRDAEVDILLTVPR